MGRTVRQITNCRGPKLKQPWRTGQPASEVRISWITPGADTGRDRDNEPQNHGGGEREDERR